MTNSRRRWLRSLRSTGRTHISTQFLRIGAFAACVSLMATSVSLAQGSAKGPELKAIVGYAGFVDNAIIHHGVAGIGARWYLTRHLAIEPAVLYMRASETDEDLVALGSVIWEYALHERIRPYLVGGIGVLHHRSQIRPGAETFSGTDVYGGGGGGVRFFATRNVTLTPELRLNFEPSWVATLAVGYTIF